MSEMKKDKALQVLADYIVNNDINYVGGLFEREDNKETFEVTVAKESALRTLKEELAAAIKLIDDGDRFSQSDVGYHNSPYCAQVREFLFKHGVVSEDERPILKYEDVNDIKEENQKLREALQNYVDAIESGSIGKIGKCFAPAKQLLEQTK